MTRGGSIYCRCAFVVSLSVLAACGLATSASAAEMDANVVGEISEPRTVLETPHPIGEFAIGRGNVVWRSTWRRAAWVGDRINATIVAEQLRTRKRTRIARLSTNPSFGWHADLALLGLSDGRILWQELVYDRWGVEDSYLRLVRIAGGRSKAVRSTLNDSWILDGDRAPFLAGELYGRMLNPDECLDEWDEPTATCRWVPAGGAFRLEGERYRALGALPPSLALSASRGRIALVPADPQETSGTGFWPRPFPAVELRSYEDGTLLHTIPLTGTPWAITLSPQVLAVLLDEGGALRLERFRPDGTFLGATSLPPETAARLESDRRWIVAHAGGRILAVNSDTGALTTLATRRNPPVELQAREGRVYWAVNGGGRGRIKSLPLPSSLQQSAGARRGSAWASGR